MTARPTVIWTFATVDGLVRLLMEVDPDKTEQLRGDLAGCAVVADDLKEFMKLAHRAVDEHGGVIGELMKQPWPTRPFRDSLKNAMHAPTTVTAAEATLKAAHAASPVEVKEFLKGPAWTVEREFVYGVVYGMDEMAANYLVRLGDALSVDVTELGTALGIEVP